MSRSICKRLFTSNWGPLSNLMNTHLTHLTHLTFSQPNSSHFFLKTFSSSSSSSSSSTSESTLAAKDDELAAQSNVVSYLINSCGLSPDRAVSLCRIYGRKLRFDSAKKPDSVIAFLRSHGFDDEDITRMVATYPVILSSSEKMLLPKFEFLYSIGFTKEDLPRFVATYDIWRKSLSGYMIPLYELLKDVMRHDQEVVVVMKRAGWLLRKSGYKGLRPNLTLLKDIGVPSPKLAYLMKCAPKQLLVDPAELCRIVNKVKGMGFDVSKTTFVLAIVALSSNYNITRDRCKDIYMEWGFSENDIQSAFKIWPRCLLLSEKKLRGTLDFLINKMGCRVDAIAQCPHTLSLDLEKRIIPRCSVIYVLVRKGLIDKDFSLSSVLIPVETAFLKRFVAKHQDIASQLLMVYQRKVDPFKESTS